MPDDDLLFASATRLLALLRAREISATELVRLHLAHIARVNPRLNAIVTLTADTALAEAAAADRRLQSGDGRALEGLPVTIKDAFATAGMSRPLALLKTASLTNARARQRHEVLATAITLVDRLVTDARALQLVLSSAPTAALNESLVRVADACARTRQALAEHESPQTTEAAAPPIPVDLHVATPRPLADMSARWSNCRQSPASRR